MIRILTLLVSLFSFGLVDLADITYEIPVTDMLYFNDTPIAELNGLTLNDVFVGGQLLLNNEFKIDGDLNGIADGWVSPTTLYVATLNNGVQKIAYGTNTNNFISIGQSITINTATTYYINSDVNSDIGNIGLLFRNGITGAIRNNFGTFNNSAVVTSTQTATTLAFYNDGSISPTRYIQLSYAYAYNLTSLGIPSLTKAQLDRYFELWQNPELNITYEINTLDTQDLVILLASQSVWTIMIHLLYKYAYRPKKKSKRLGM